MDIANLQAYQDQAIEHCSQDQSKFRHLLCTIGTFRGYSLDNLLILSERLEKNLDADLVTADDVKAAGFQPDIEDAIWLIGADKELMDMYDLNTYLENHETPVEDTSLEAVSSNWFSKMTTLLLRFRKGTSTMPSLFSSIRWEKDTTTDTTDYPPAYIVDNNGKRELVISAKKDMLPQTFFMAIKACVQELFNKNSGFDIFSAEIKSELAGYVTVAYLSSQELLEGEAERMGKGLPISYLKKYTDPEDFKMYVNLILLTLNMISPLNSLTEEPNVPEQVQTGLKSDDFFKMGVTMDEDTMEQINKANAASASDSDSSGGFVPVQEEPESSEFTEPDDGTFQPDPGEEEGFV